MKKDMTTESVAQRVETLMPIEFLPRKDWCMCDSNDVRKIITTLITENDKLRESLAADAVPVAQRVEALIPPHDKEHTFRWSSESPTRYWNESSIRSTITALVTENDKLRAALAISNKKVQSPEWLVGLPEGTTHISKIDPVTLKGGTQEATFYAFKYRSGELVCYSTDSDNEYACWKSVERKFKEPPEIFQIAENSAIAAAGAAMARDVQPATVAVGEAANRAAGLVLLDVALMLAQQLVDQIEKLEPLMQPALTAQAEPSDELVKALRLAEAALSDIGDADREPGDDLAWCEKRAAQLLPAIRTTLARHTGEGEL